MLFFNADFSLKWTYFGNNIYTYIFLEKNSLISDFFEPFFNEIKMQ